MPTACGIPKVGSLPTSAPTGNRYGRPRLTGSRRAPPTGRWRAGSGGPGCRPTARGTRGPPAVARHWRRREPVGAHCQLSPAQLDELQVRLDAGPAAEGWADQCWTLARIAALVRTRFGVNYTLPGLDLLLHRMGWSVQVPARRAAERDEERITAWREETWPAVKRPRRTWAPGWSSKTSPARGSGRPRDGPGAAAAAPRWYG